MKPLLLLIACTLGVYRMNAQSVAQDSITNIILSLDSALFITGFNQSDLRPFEKLIHDDFEFYHDIGGFQDRAKFLDAMRNGLFADIKNYRSYRYLDPSSSSVHLLYSNGVLYGAIQTGQHQFYEKIGEQPEQYASTALFTHYWEWDQNEWKLKRVFSYNHHK
jgi:hypothetical protein